MRIKPRVQIRNIDGIDHRICIDCGIWFPFDHQWGKPYCNKCLNFRNKLQKEKRKRDNNRKKVKTFFIGEIEYRLCHRCNKEIIYNPSISYCKECANIVWRINYRDKERTEKSYNKKIENKRIMNLFEGYDNEEAKKAMIDGDFKKFMIATENQNRQ